MLGCVQDQSAAVDNATDQRPTLPVDNDQCNVAAPTSVAAAAAEVDQSNGANNDATAGNDNITDQS